MNDPATTLLLTALAFLWRGDLGEQRACLVTAHAVLIPQGTELRAHRPADGKILWTHRMRESRGALEVPARIQAVELIRSAPAPLSGLLPPPDARQPVEHLAVIAGPAEIRCISARSGASEWRSAKSDGCLISLHLAGDVDGDGMVDLVGCGCNVAECFSGRTGAVLWEVPVTGRSLWAGPCGDLDGDGLGEVLLQAGTDLRVIACPRPRETRDLFVVDGFLPHASLPGAAGFLAVFPGAEARRYAPGGKGERVWEERAPLIGAFTLDRKPVLATRAGIWREASPGAWNALCRGTISAAAASEGRLFFALGEGEIHDFPAGATAPRRLVTLADEIDGLVTDDGGSLLAVITADECRVYRVAEHGGAR